MKPFYFIIACLIFFMPSCRNKAKGDFHKGRNIKSIHTCEVIKGDTLNRTDFAGEKQGRWVITKGVVVTKTVQSAYTGQAGLHTKVVKELEWLKLEEGMYVNNKKEGVWKSFHPSGSLKYSILYKNSVAVNTF